MKQIFIGTNNQGKLSEFADAFKTLNIKITSPAQLGLEAEIAETGNTFSENALIKARAWAKLSNLPTLVDDSGLCVNALGGQPGVFSARLSEGNDADRNIKILEMLKPYKMEQRTAHYTCVIAFIDLDNKIEYTSEGTCQGHILTQPCGNNGFGYDPIFQPIGYRQSFGELSIDIKQKISHRAIALVKMVEYLRKIN